MSDRYASFAHWAPGRALVRRLGLPDPPRLRRYRPGDPPVAGPILVGGSGRLGKPLQDIAELAGSAGAAGSTAGADEDRRIAGLGYDASGITDTAGLRGLYDFFHPHARSLRSGGRVVVLGTPPRDCATTAGATAQRAVEGFVRSVGKEFGRGMTAQLVAVRPGAEDGVEATLRFLFSHRSAYVSGQVIDIEPAPANPPADWDRPLAGRVAVVTGASRGIGESITRVLTRDGAHVVCVDVPGVGDTLSTVANDVGGTAVQLDIAAPDAAGRLAGHLADRHGRVDIVVHNAGITRDRTLRRMQPEQWDAVLAVNLASQERINAVLLDRDLVPDGGRIIGVSSVSGIAGNRGQTNYATSKAGVIGLVEAMAPVLAERRITVNAVAPGFIETGMTARMPMVVREAGRRLNSLAQGGLPVDVAETVAWLASPGCAGVTGNVVRVCGQSILGA